PPPPTPIAPHPETARPPLDALRVLGQAQDLFVIAEGGGKLWIIDQHVAHERILFERLAAPDLVEGSEPLLVPLVLELDARQLLAVIEHQEMLADLGFAMEAFGSSQIRVRAVPRSLLGRNY